MPSTTGPSAPGSSGRPARSTTAPAPSAKMTAVERSVGSTMVVNASAPMSRTRSATPVAISPAAVASPYRKPVHTAETSKAGTPARPSRAATSGAVAGQIRSGVVVARTTAPARLSPEESSARRPASTARSEVAMPGETRCLVRMPVRVRIHSSEVSRWAERSSLVTTCGGTQPPTPASTAVLSSTGSVVLMRTPRKVRAPWKVRTPRWARGERTGRRPAAAGR